jgi:hypothetical protein
MNITHSEPVSEVQGPAVRDNKFSNPTFFITFVYRVLQWGFARRVRDKVFPQALDVAGGRILWMELEMEKYLVMGVLPFLSSKGLLFIRASVHVIKSIFLCPMKQWSQILLGVSPCQQA